MKNSQQVTRGIAIKGFSGMRRVVARFKLLSRLIGTQFRNPLLAIPPTLAVIVQLQTENLTSS